jgi:hypothetical protein
MAAAFAGDSVLRAAQHQRLKRLARSAAPPWPTGWSCGAQIVLRAASGGTNAAIAAALEVHLNTVRRWRHRFAVENAANTAGDERRSVVAMLDDRPRSARPRISGPHERVKSWRR